MIYLSRPQPATRNAQFSAKSLLVSVIAAAGLSACQHTPEPRIETVEVKVPVAVQPIKPEQVPVAPTPLPKRPPSLSDAADVLASKWCEAVAYIIRAAPLLSLSAGLPPAQAPDYPECDKK